ncbi:MAG: hypothetical protein BWY42_01747 [Candidatus Omnitrophica bacterium ADurb.Bin277]|nr:MAG: hypothetical protein BWY42_01747 [Candidatus Omnitrophica bacterium ADurb.Bin277]
MHFPVFGTDVQHLPQFFFRRFLPIGFHQQLCDLHTNCDPGGIHLQIAPVNDNGFFIFVLIFIKGGKARPGRFKGRSLRNNLLIELFRILRPIHLRQCFCVIKHPDDMIGIKRKQFLISLLGLVIFLLLAVNRRQIKIGDRIFRIHFRDGLILPDGFVIFAQIEIQAAQNRPKFDIAGIFRQGGLSERQGRIDIIVFDVERNQLGGQIRRIGRKGKRAFHLIDRFVQISVQP